MVQASEAEEKLPRWQDMRVYEIRGTLLGSLLSGNPTIWGTVSGSLFFVTPHMNQCSTGCTDPVAPRRRPRTLAACDVLPLQGLASP